MKNQLMVIGVGVVVGVAIVFGILGLNNTMQAQYMPMLTSLSNQNAQILQKVVTLEAKVKDLEEKMNRRQAAPAMPMPPAEDPNKVYDIPVANSPVIGPMDAPITIVEFTDLQCPFCARFFPPVEQVLKEYPNDVRLVIKHFPLPFHPNARPAAKLALASHEQGKYLEMVTALLQNGAQVDEPSIKSYAKNLGLDERKLIDDLKNRDSEWEDRLKEDEALISSSNVNGTPTFFLNGKKTTARDFATWKAAIEQLLAEKK